MHYRWLEEPPDPAWLKAQALARLDRRAAARSATRGRRTGERSSSCDRSSGNNLARVTGLDLAESLAAPAARHSAAGRAHLQAGRTSGRPSGELAASKARRQPTCDRPGIWARAWRPSFGALDDSPVREGDGARRHPRTARLSSAVPEVPVETRLSKSRPIPSCFPGRAWPSRPGESIRRETIAPHLVGYRTPIDDDDLRERRARFPHGDPLDYQPGDRWAGPGSNATTNAICGACAACESWCSIVAARCCGRKRSASPRYGHDLVLSLTLPLQRVAEQLLDDVLDRQHRTKRTAKPLPMPPGGAIVAIDVRTGAVLAAASAPRFDLRLFADPRCGGVESGSWPIRGNRCFTGPPKWPCPRARYSKC